MSDNGSSFFAGLDGDKQMGVSAPYAEPYAKGRDTFSQTLERHEQLLAGLERSKAPMQPVLELERVHAKAIADLEERVKRLEAVTADHILPLRTEQQTKPQLTAAEQAHVKTLRDLSRGYVELIKQSADPLKGRLLAMFGQSPRELADHVNAIDWALGRLGV